MTTANGLTPEIEQGRKVFDSTLSSAHALIARGVAPAAIVSGLLGVAVEIGNTAIGQTEMRRMLMLAADSNSDQLDD